MSAGVHFVDVDHTGRQRGPGRGARAHVAKSNWQAVRAREVRARQQRRNADLEAASPASSEPTSESSLVGLPALRRTVSPVFGAIETTTFENGDILTIERITEHCVRVMWPDLLHDKRSITAWYRAFCEYPVIFHGFHYAAAVHADALQGQKTLSRRPDMLIHKNKTIHLLNNMISHMDEVDVEIVIHIVLMLTWNELEASNSESSPHSSYLSPAYPNAGWLNVFGQMGAVDPHMHVLHQLIDRVGGLDALKFPGLASIIALGDLIASSMQLVQPRYQCFWPSQVPHLVPFGLLKSSYAKHAGESFRAYLAEGTMQAVATLLVEVAELDRAMSECRRRRLSEEDYQALIYARNAAHHHLLSRWALDLQQSRQSWSNMQSLRDLCSTTALLYSTSVLFPLPGHLMWRSRLIQTLQQLLEHVRSEYMEHQHQRLLIWATCVGALTAYDHAEQSFFEHELAALLLQTGYTSLSGLRNVLQDFLWSQEACGAALEVLWLRLSNLESQ